MEAGGLPLRARLYIPESCAVEQRNAINTRRLAHWSRAVPRPGQPARRMILIAEVKGIVPARIIDTENAPTTIFMGRGGQSAVRSHSQAIDRPGAGMSTWWWHPSEEAMPQLPSLHDGGG